MFWGAFAPLFLNRLNLLENNASVIYIYSVSVSKSHQNKRILFRITVFLSLKCYDYQVKIIAVIKTNVQ